MFHATHLKHPVVTLAVTIGTMILTLFAVPAAQAACTAAPTSKVFAAFGDNADYASRRRVRSRPARPAGR